MPTTLPTRQQVDAAEPLDFEQRRQVSRQQVAITIKAAVDGFPVELGFTGRVEQLPNIMRRLRELGAEPVSAAQPQPAPAAQQPSSPKPKAQRVQPVYDGDGTPLCPKHRKPLKEWHWGLYCTAKDDSTERGYCALEFAEE